MVSKVVLALLLTSLGFLNGQAEAQEGTPTPAPLPQCDNSLYGTCWYYDRCVQFAQSTQGPEVDAFWCDSVYLIDCTCPTPAPVPQCQDCQTYSDCILNAQATGTDTGSCYQYLNGCFCPRPTFPPGSTPPNCAVGNCNDYNACMTPASEELCNWYHPSTCSCSSTTTAAPGLPECTSERDCRYYNYCLSPNQTYCRQRFLIDCTCPEPTPTPTPTPPPVPECAFWTCNDYNACMTPPNEEWCQDYYGPVRCSCRSTTTSLPQCTSEADCSDYNWCMTPTNETHCRTYLINCTCSPPTPPPTPTPTPVPLPQCPSGWCDNYNNCMEPPTEEYCRTYFGPPGNNCTCPSTTTSAPTTTSLPECIWNWQCYQFNNCMAPRNETQCRQSNLFGCFCP